MGIRRTYGIITPADVWTYGNRLLTGVMGIVEQVKSVGSQANPVGGTWYTLNDLIAPANRSLVVYTAKVAATFVAATNRVRLTIDGQPVTQSAGIATSASYYWCLAKDNVTLLGAAATPLAIRDTFILCKTFKLEMEMDAGGNTTSLNSEVLWGQMA